MFDLLQRDGSRFGESGNVNRYWIWRWDLRNNVGIAMSLAPPIKLMVGIPPIKMVNGGWFMALLYQHYKISSTSLRSEMNIYMPWYSQSAALEVPPPGLIAWSVAVTRPKNMSHVTRSSQEWSETPKKHVELKPISTLPRIFNHTLHVQGRYFSLVASLGMFRVGRPSKSQGLPSGNLT